jgi:phosphoribosylformylglycinamidine synthase
MFDVSPAGVPQVHDRMTEQVYPEPLHSFATDAVPAPVVTIPVLADGRAALEKINKVRGPAWLG